MKDATFHQKTLIPRPVGVKLGVKSWNWGRTVVHAKPAKRPCSRPLPAKDGGGSGIRTHEPRERLAVFKTAAFVHSAIPPRQAIMPFPDSAVERRGLLRSQSAPNGHVTGFYDSARESAD